MGVSELGEPELIRVTMIDYFTSEVLIDKLVYPDIPMEHLNTRYSGVSYQQLNQAQRNRNCFKGKRAAREAVWEYVGPKTFIIGHSAQNDLAALRIIHRNVLDTFDLEHRLLEKERQRVITSAAMTENHSSEEDLQQNISSPSSTATDGKKKVKGSGALSLKTAAKSHLNRDIQSNQSHDSREDAFATRDLARWHVLNFDSP